MTSKMKEAVDFCWNANEQTLGGKFDLKFWARCFGVDSSELQRHLLDKVLEQGKHMIRVREIAEAGTKRQESAG